MNIAFVCRVLYRASALCRHLLLNKYDHHITYVSHTTNILNGHRDLTFLHIYAQKQPIARHTSYVIPKYVPTK